MEHASGDSDVDLRPPFPTVGEWTPQTNGNLHPNQLSDEVLHSFLFLTGIRHVVTHATLNAFNIACKTDQYGQERVIVEFDPSAADSDPAVKGVYDSNGTQRSFSDSYLRYEQDFHTVTHPIDYIQTNHHDYILPFFNDIMGYM